MVTDISRGEVADRIEAGDAVVVEALPPLHWEKEHLPGAINLPHDEVEELAPTLLPDQQGTVIVYCANEPCPNSGIAAQRLERLGYVDVREYAGGKEDWAAAGLPFESVTRA